MAHLLDYSKKFYAFVHTGAAAWHGLGQSFDGDLSTREALQLGGLDFEVYKSPNIHCLPNGEQIKSESSFFTYRDDVMRVLAAHVGSDYTVMQNIDVFNLVDEILQNGTAKIETAGAIDGGKKVFICLKANSGIRVGDSDMINQYVILSNSHDGSGAISATPTNVRVVCNNTLTAALRGAKGSIKIRHTANAGERMKEATKVLGLIHHNTQINCDNYNAMREIQIDENKMFQYFGNVFLSKETIEKLQKGEPSRVAIPAKSQNVLKDVLKFAKNGTGQDMAMTGGNGLNMWVAYNAVTGYLSRKKFENANARSKNLLFGSGADQIQTAGVLALEPEKLVPTTKIFGKTQMPGFNLN